MQNLIKFYIVVHNIELVELFERTKKYEKLIDYDYLLVGEHENDYSTLPHVIQCNRLAGNIEWKKNFLAYTGWHAAHTIQRALHEIHSIKCRPYICLLEYDTDLTENFNLTKLEEEITQSEADLCGFFSLDTKTAFLNNDIFSNRLIDFLKVEGVREIVPTGHKWIVSNNVIFKIELLQEFFRSETTQKFFSFLGDDKMAGHFLERYTSVYCFLNNKKIFIEEYNMFIHRALDSHDTQNRKYGNEGYEKFAIANKISH